MKNFKQATLLFSIALIPLSVTAMEENNKRLSKLLSKKQNNTLQQTLETPEHDGQLRCLELEPKKIGPLTEETPWSFERVVEEAIHENILDSRDEYGKTILRNAIYSKKPEYVEILCSLGADPFVKDDQDEHAFHDAAKLGDLQTLRILLKFHSNNPIWKSIRESHNTQTRCITPLAYAQRNGHEICAFVLKNFHKYQNSITKSIVLGNINKLRKIIDTDLWRIDLKVTEGNDSYCTPLTLAVLLQDYEMVNFLLEKGARNPGTFITKYLAKDIPDNIKDLLKKHNIQVMPPFKPFPSNNCKQMPLSNAVRAEYKSEVTKALKKSGATINGFDYKGNTALHWACTIGSPTMIDLLLQQGTDPNMVDLDKQRTGLHWLLRMHKESVKKNGTQIATSVFLPCLFMLISAGADPEIKDSQGKTFLDWIEKNFKDHHKELAYRILQVKSLSSTERIKLLEDISDFQVGQMNKWHLNNSNFNLRDVAHIKAVCVKKSGKDSDFKDMYKKYI